MTMMPSLDMQKVQTFAMKVLGDVTALQMGTLSAVADRLGLFAILASADPLTTEEFARKAHINERYAREWLSAMACHGYLVYNDATKAFTLPPEHAIVLADPDSSVYLGSFFPMARPYWMNLDLLTDAFRNGGGVPQAAYGDEFWCGFERFTRPVFRNHLAQDWVPAMPEVDARLRNGGRPPILAAATARPCSIWPKPIPRRRWWAMTPMLQPSPLLTPTL